jgi:hypothetical protein
MDTVATVSQQAPKPLSALATEFQSSAAKAGAALAASQAAGAKTDAAAPPVAPPAPPAVGTADELDAALDAAMELPNPDFDDDEDDEDEAKRVIAEHTLKLATAEAEATAAAAAAQKATGDEAVLLKKRAALKKQEAEVYRDAVKKVVPRPRLIFKGTRKATEVELDAIKKLKAAVDHAKEAKEKLTKESAPADITAAAALIRSAEGAYFSERNNFLCEHEDKCVNVGCLRHTKEFLKTVDEAKTMVDTLKLDKDQAQQATVMYNTISQSAKRDRTFLKNPLVVAAFDGIAEPLAVLIEKFSDRPCFGFGVVARVFETIFTPHSKKGGERKKGPEHTASAAYLAKLMSSYNTLELAEAAKAKKAAMAAQAAAVEAEKQATKALEQAAARLADSKAKAATVAAAAIAAEAKANEAAPTSLVAETSEEW